MCFNSADCEAGGCEKVENKICQKLLDLPSSCEASET